jgi:hypothetical protein
MPGSLKRWRPVDSLPADAPSPPEAMEGQTFSGRQAQRVNLSGMVPDLAYAGRTLIAFGESADTVPERLRRIGEGAAGVRAFWGRVGGRGAG